VIDAEIVETGLETLGVAIAMLVEDAHEGAVRRLPSPSKARSRKIAELGAVGQDVVTLAAAMEVLQRRRPARTD
jgi:hypothetical protein